MLIIKLKENEKVLYQCFIGGFKNFIVHISAFSGQVKEHYNQFYFENNKYYRDPSVDLNIEEGCKFEEVEITKMITTNNMKIKKVDIESNKIYYIVGNLLIQGRWKKK